MTWRVGQDGRVPQRRTEDACSHARREGLAGVPVPRGVWKTGRVSPGGSLSGMLGVGVEGPEPGPDAR